MNIKKELIKTFKALMGLPSYFGKVYSDGELKISDKAVGGKVETIQADGSLAPAEDGDYVMDNGFSFTVKDGVITAIVGEEAPVEAAAPASEAGEDPAEEATESPADEATEDQADAAIAEMQKKIDDLSARLDALEKANTQMAAEKIESAAAIESFTKTVKELNDNITTLAKVPVEFAKTNKSAVVEESKEEKLLGIARLLGGLNKK